MSILIALIAIAAASSVDPARDGASIDGNWTSPSGNVVVTIAPCEAAMCGRVSWASDRAKADARRAGTDPLIGAELLTGFTATRNGRWKGRLFVPDLNRRSRAELRLVDPDRIKISGCMVGRILCKSQLWTRSTGDAAP